MVTKARHHIWSRTDSGGTVAGKYAKFLITSKNFNFAFHRNLWGIAWKSWKGVAMPGKEKQIKTREFLQNTGREEEYLERGDEEEAKQGKESTEDRNKKDEQKVSASGGDERESHGAARPDEEEKQEGWAVKKAAQKRWDNRLFTGGSREGIQDKARWTRDKEESRGTYHGYSAGTAYSAARSTAVTNAATATEVTRVYADDP